MPNPVPPTTQTASLVAGAIRGDRPAIEGLLIRQLPGLEAFVRLRMGAGLRNRTEPQDLVQSVCREVLEDLSGFEYRGEGPFRHWLYTRAENKLREKARYHGAQMRSAAREEALETGGIIDAYRSICTPTRELAAREELARIEAAFDTLSEDHREAIVLHKIVGLSHAEIAARLGRSEGAVRNLVYRGLSRLALIVDAETEPGSPV